MNSSIPLEIEEQGIGNDSYYAVSAVSPNAHHQYKKSSLFSIDRIPNHYLMLHRYWRTHILRNPRANNQFFDCITQNRHQHIHLFARQLEDYSNEANLSAVMAAIQYSKTLLQNQDDKVPDYEPSDDDNEYSRLQNPPKTPIIPNNFFRALPYCPIIH
jgi:hypothetical protein